MCDKRARLKCNATAECATVYCSQQCGDANLQDHLCSTLIGVNINMKDIVNETDERILARMLYQLPIATVWTLCKRLQTVRELCNRKKFRIAYLKQQGRDKITRALLAQFKDGESLLYSSFHSIVPWLLNAVIDTKMFDLAASDNMAFKLASSLGHAEVVEWLMMHMRVNPAVDDNYAIRVASHNGYADVVALLLRDDRVDPDAHESNALRNAIYNGHNHIAR